MVKRFTEREVVDLLQEIYLAHVDSLTHASRGESYEAHQRSERAVVLIKDLQCDYLNRCGIL